MGQTPSAPTTPASRARDEEIDDAHETWRRDKHLGAIQRRNNACDEAEKRYENTTYF